MCSKQADLDILFVEKKAIAQRRMILNFKNKNFCKRNFIHTKLVVYSL